MRIAALGTPNRLKELENLFKPSNQEIFVANDGNFESFDILFDLTFDDNPSSLKNYENAKNTIVILSSAKIQLEQLFYEYKLGPKHNFFGMNCLPTFINRSLLEICSLFEDDRQVMNDLMTNFNIPIKWVKSRTGLATPRVVFMIINEAYYTVQEGTASKEDIDIAMKLGTNYPFGPFEWAQKIGLKNVYETLLAVYEDTKDERYKICPLLKTEYYREMGNLNYSS